jgi:hypothetical protein
MAIRREYRPVCDLCLEPADFTRGDEESAWWAARRQGWITGEYADEYGGTTAHLCPDCAERPRPKWWRFESPEENVQRFPSRESFRRWLKGGPLE